MTWPWIKAMAGNTDPKGQLLLELEKAIKRMFYFTVFCRKEINIIHHSQVYTYKIFLKQFFTPNVVFWLFSHQCCNRIKYNRVFISCWCNLLNWLHGVIDEKKRSSYLAIEFEKAEGYQIGDFWVCIYCILFYYSTDVKIIRKQYLQ